MKITILIPAYNERNTIREILRRVDALAFDKQVIVVDDGSTDGTREILQGMQGRSIELILLNENRGKGAALRTALEHAVGDLVVIQDADLEYDPRDLERMVRVMQEEKMKVLYGSRVLGNAPWSGVGFYLGGRFLSLLTNVLYGSRITDEPTCYKMFDRQLLVSLRLSAERFEFCPEVTAKVLRLGYMIHEVPISYTPRSRLAGKKIKFMDGIAAIWTLLRHRWIPISRFSSREPAGGNH